MTHQILCKNPDGQHQITYREWGEPQQTKVLICVHGLTRNSQDFTKLATALKSDYRVICPDVVGRGESDYLTNPAHYGIPLYVEDLLTLIRQLNFTSVDWLGTSMGGLIGMTIASLENSPINRLILNDIGAYIPEQAIERIASYLTQKAPIFSDLTQVKEYVKKIYSGFGDLTESQWSNLAQYSVKLNQNGQYILNYDPAIATPFLGLKSGQFQPIDFGQIWHLISCPVLLLHGENSDLLLPETIAQMQETNPQLEVKHLANCGHAPALMSSEQIDLIKTWLG
jgi:pimeloyl-ACP methyl ester carboxylesterase